MGPPAFVQRALEVERCEAELRSLVLARRAEALEGVTVAAKRLVALSGSIDAAAAAFDVPADFLGVLEEARRDPHFEEYWVDLDVRPEETARTLAERIARFDRQWPEILAEVDLGPLNEAIDRYDRNYEIEREVFARHTEASQWRRPTLAPRTLADLEQEFPLLPRLSPVTRS